MICTMASTLVLVASLGLADRVEWGGIVEMDGKIVGLYSYGHHDLGADSGLVRARAYFDYVDGAGAIRMQHITFVESEEGVVQEMTINLRNGDEKLDALWKVEGGKRLRQGTEEEEPWDPETLGLYGVLKMMKEATFTAKVFHAELGAATWTWTVAGKEVLKIGGEEISCTRIDGTCDAAPDRTFSRWVDDRFQTQRESIPAGGAVVTITRVPMEEWQTWESLLDGGGTVAGRRFQHPDLGLSLEWPEGWKAEFVRRPSPVLSLRPGEGIVVLSVVTAAPRSIGVDEILQRTKAKHGEYTSTKRTMDGVEATDARFGDTIRLVIVPSDKGLFMLLLENPSEASHAAFDAVVKSVDILH